MMPLGEWYGVETDASGRVVSLDLSGTWGEEAFQWKRHGLAGQIPPELGNLERLQSLVLAGNELQGDIPPELGNLTELTRLDLGNNSLTGAIPSEFGDLARLRELDLRDNRLTGAIPSRLGRLWDRSELTVLVLSGNTLFGEIPPHLRNLSELTVLSLDDNSLSDRIPRELGQLTALKALSLGDNRLDGPVPPELGKMVGLERLDLHGNWLRGGIPPELGNLVNLRELHLRDNQLTGIPPELGNLANLHELFLHDNQLTGSLPPELGNLLRETTAIRALEGGTGHYMGMMAPPVSGPSGLAHLPGRSSFSQPYSTLIPHLLGHNFFLGDAPCGDVVRLDRSFPNALGAIGVWAYDPRGSGRLLPPTRLDIMSYCDFVWISDYHFANALRFRLNEADSVGLPMVVPSTQGLLLWGGVDADGAPFLEPAFVVDAPPSLPRSSGGFRLAGRTDDGVERFSFGFKMPVVADGDGSSGFAFVLPVEEGWEGTLASITLSGPGGSFALDTGNDLSMAVLRDPRTGQIRGFLRELPGTVLTHADALAAVSPEPGLEVLFSRGISAAESWRR